MARLRNPAHRNSFASLALVTVLTVSFVSRTPTIHVHAEPLAASRCGSVGVAPAPSVQAGRPFLFAAYQALNADRARLADLPAQRYSAILSRIAERHSAYMASIGTWSDGDPAGGILTRVHDAGVAATYAGQNVVTANGATAIAAIQQGEAFFAGEAQGGGPHWDNITNPNHRYMGIGIALLGGPGNYTIYLTQVFSDGGGCTDPAVDTFTAASSVAPALHIGASAHPSVDTLQLRTEPRGTVIGTLHARDRVRIVDMRQGWAQVLVLATNTVGWVFAPFLTTT